MAIAPSSRGHQNTHQGHRNTLEAIDLLSTSGHSRTEHHRKRSCLCHHAHHTPCEHLDAAQLRRGWGDDFGIWEIPAIPAITAIDQPRCNRYASATEWQVRADCMTGDGLCMSVCTISDLCPAADLIGVVISAVWCRVALVSLRSPGLFSSLSVLLSPVYVCSVSGCSRKGRLVGILQHRFPNEFPCFR